jgi:type I restriction enzyme R subunit
MIGRGTRLCPDVLVQINPKTILIFDVCANFEFSKCRNKGRKPYLKPITQQIFESRMHPSRLLVETGEEGDIELSTSLRDILHKSIDSLDKERFQVAMNLRHVDEF